MSCCYCDPIGLDRYGYPKVDFMGRNKNGSWVRVTEGWFFPGEDTDETACYLECHVSSRGRIIIELNWCGVIHFDFETPLDDYLLPCSKTMTIGDYYQKYVKETKFD